MLDVSLYMRDQKTLTKKEKMIEAEMNSLGYVLAYTKHTSDELLMSVSSFENVSPYMKLNAFTLRYHLNENEVGRYIIIVYPELMKVKRRKRMQFLLQIMIHELTHAILLEDKTWSKLKDGISDLLTFHGLRFSEVYTDLCNKYRIKHQDASIYLR